MSTYRSKPQTVEAVQWTGDHDSFFEVDEFADEKVFLHHDGALDLLAGKDGSQQWVPVPVGHWLVNQPGDKSDIWPVDPDYFAAKYEPESDL